MNRRRLAVLFLLLGAAVAFGRDLSFQRYTAVRDSLRYLPPNIRSYYLDKAGFDMWPAAQPRPESTGLRLIGKWGAGPSVRVTGRDSIVYLSRGSEVVVINYADTANPRVLTTIQAPGLVARSILVGNRLYISSGYIETFDISDPANPVKLGSLFARAPAIDIADTLVYTLYRDSFKVFNFADPANPAMLGACRDSGYDLSVCNGYAYVGDGGGLYVLDVTDPAAPHRVANWGNDVIGVRARTTICCATTGNPNNPGGLRFTILDVRNPASPTPLGSLDSCGGYDIFLDDSLAFLSGYYTGGHEFQVVGIGDTVNPTRIGSCNTPGENFGVWANRLRKRAYVADTYLGLQVIGIGDLSSPVVDTNLLGAGSSEDVWVDGHLAYVAGVSFGMTVLDVSSPASPVELGHVDSTRDMIAQTVVARDSFAYMCWQTHPWLKVVDVSDPANPAKAASCDLFNPPVGMVLCDSFLYVAEDYKFQVVNVARPREPVLVGSCALSGDVWDLDVEDSMAYVTSNAFTTVNIARPDSPRVVATWNPMVGVDVMDTTAYLCGSGAVWSLNVANPASPYVLDTVRISGWVSDVVVGESLAFAGGQQLYVINISDPWNLRVVGQWTPPHEFRRLLWTPAYLYAACYEAGVCVLETVPLGLEEPQEKGGTQASIRLSPSVTTGPVTITAGRGNGRLSVRLYDGAGARVGESATLGKLGATTVQLDLSGYPDGVYFVNLQRHGMNSTMKVVKTKRR